jgi:hypothetical protein
MAEAEHVLRSRAFRQAVAGIQRRDTQEALTEDERRLMVPIDDRRSIRRITFDPDSMAWLATAS